MIAMRAGTKRARSADANANANAVASKQAMLMADDSGDDVLMEDEDDNQAEEESEDERGRRKRAMRVREDLRFLEKLPTLREYQRGRFGRRGGVDGGAPHDDTSLWMRALERSLEETSFVTGEAPARAALVTPLACAPSGSNTSRGYAVAPMRVTPTPAPTPVHRANMPLNGLRMGSNAVGRTAYAGYVAVAPVASTRAAVAVAVMVGGGKDDEARAADR